jgi:hypothetical protein
LAMRHAPTKYRSAGMLRAGRPSYVHNMRARICTSSAATMPAVPRSDRVSASRWTLARPRDVFLKRAAIAPTPDREAGARRASASPRTESTEHFACIRRAWMEQRVLLHRSVSRGPGGDIATPTVTWRGHPFRRAIDPSIGARRSRPSDGNGQHGTGIDGEIGQKMRNHGRGAAAGAPADQAKNEAPDGDGDKSPGICVIDRMTGGKENRRQQPRTPIPQPGRRETAPEKTTEHRFLHEGCINVGLIRFQQIT